MSVQSTPIIVHGVSLEKFLSSRRNYSSDKEQALLFQKKVFQYLDDWIDRQKPQQHVDCDVEDMAMNLLEKHAVLQERVNDVKNVIRTEWMNNTTDIHQYDPECEYECHVQAIICLFKCFMLDSNHVITIAGNNTCSDLYQVLEALNNHFPASDAESLRYLISGRGLLKDNMDISDESGYYTFLYAEECKSLLNAIVYIKQQYERELMMGRVEEERQMYSYGISAYGDDEEYDPELNSVVVDEEFAMHDEYDEPYAESSSSHKRKRRDHTGSCYKKRRSNRAKFTKLSAQVEDTLNELIKSLVAVTQKDLDLFMYVQNV
jgi:hypothetical protein